MVAQPHRHTGVEPAMDHINACAPTGGNQDAQHQTSFGTYITWLNIVTCLHCHSLVTQLHTVTYRNIRLCTLHTYKVELANRAGLKTLQLHTPVPRHLHLRPESTTDDDPFSPCIVVDFPHNLYRNVSIEYRSRIERVPTSVSIEHTCVRYTSIMVHTRYEISALVGAQQCIELWIQSQFR